MSAQLHVFQNVLIFDITIFCFNNDSIQADMDKSWWSDSWVRLICLECGVYPDAGRPLPCPSPIVSGMFPQTVSLRDRQPWSGARAAPDVLCWRPGVRCGGPEQSQAVREPCELCYWTAVEVSKRASTNAQDDRAGPESPSVPDASSSGWKQDQPHGWRFSGGYALCCAQVQSENMKVKEKLCSKS